MKYLLFTFSVLLFAAGCLTAKDPPRLKIVSVEFEGNRAFQDKQLHTLIRCKPSAFLRPSYYDEHALQDDLRNLILFYNQRGYFQAEIIRQQVTIDTLKQRVRIRIQLEEGELTRVDSIRVRGNTVIPAELLLRKSGLSPGSPFSLIELQRTRENILNQYSERGYLEADITPDISIDTLANLASLQLILQENTRFTIDQIHIEGLEKTRPGVVWRELRFKSGDIVNFAKLLDSQQELYATGLFRSVYVHPETASSGDSTRKDILIELKEAQAGEFNIGLSYGTVEKFRGTSELFYNNLFGKALITGVDAVASSRQRTITSFVTEPWIFGIPVSANVSVPIGILDEPGFTLQAYGVELALGYEFARRSTIELAFQGGLGKVTVTNAPLLFEDAGFDTLPPDVQNLLREIDDANIDLETIKLTLVFDKRNNLVNTTKGSYMEFSIGNSRSSVTFDIVNTSIPVDTSITAANDFLRYVAIFKYFHSFNPVTVFASAVELGIINNLSGIPELIPPSELFFTGGPNSLRGFEYQKVGPLGPDGEPLGGRLKLVWNVIEIRRRLYKIIDGLVFVDAGNVWESPGDFKLDDIRYDAGLGIRVFTPLGYLRLDYGINLAPHENEPKGQWWFGIGQAF